MCAGRTGSTQSCQASREISVEIEAAERNRAELPDLGSRLTQRDQPLEPGADRGPSVPDIRRQRVDDVRPAAFARDDAGVAKDLEVVTDRRLANGAALDEVAG